MSRNTTEYDTLLRATSKLTKVVKNNITSLCSELVSSRLITPEQQRALRNPNHDVFERAADLVTLITDKVEEDCSRYHDFVGILKQDENTYREVLKVLELPNDTPDGAESDTVKKLTTSCTNGLSTSKLNFGVQVMLILIE